MYWCPIQTHLIGAGGGTLELLPGLGETLCGVLVSSALPLHPDVCFLFFSQQKSKLNVLTLISPELNRGLGGIHRGQVERY